MYSLELTRAIAADRERQVERDLLHRRLVELFAEATSWLRGGRLATRGPGSPNRH